MKTEKFDTLFPKADVDDSKFDKWMMAVDRMITSKIGLGSSDLPDYCYRDAFDDDATPKQAASAAIKAAQDF